MRADRSLLTAPRRTSPGPESVNATLLAFTWRRSTSPLPLLVTFSSRTPPRARMSPGPCEVRTKRSPPIDSSSTSPLPLLLRLFRPEAPMRTTTSAWSRLPQWMPKLLRARWRTTRVPLRTSVSISASCFGSPDSSRRGAPSLTMTRNGPASSMALKAPTARLSTVTGARRSSADTVCMLAKPAHRTRAARADCLTRMFMDVLVVFVESGAGTIIQSRAGRAVEPIDVQNQGINDQKRAPNGAAVRRRCGCRARQVS